MVIHVLREAGADEPLVRDAALVALFLEVGNHAVVHLNCHLTVLLCHVRVCHGLAEVVLLAHAHSSKFRMSSLYVANLSDVTLHAF